ncbi:MAG TPA: polysaccharide deacetylase family protein [Trebonia sp.]|nr:polysaccharide deacetylase family protein [Trebonia sp.]
MTAASPLRVPVLMYHEIADISATPSRLAVSPDVFADQLAYLRDAGFNAVTAGALSAILAEGAGHLPERPVVLTFDDGYGDFYSQGLPLLKQHGYTGTLFMTTGWIGEEDEKKRMLNWRELAEIEQAGIEVGAHTCKHPQLDQLPEKLIREELYVSKSLLEDKLGLKVPGLAYPFGYSNAKVRRMAREIGYDYGYAVGNAMTTGAADAFALPRLTVRRATSMDDFRKMVSGEDTMMLRQDRVLTSGFSVVRRARSTLRAMRGQA